LLGRGDHQRRHGHCYSVHRQGGFNTTLAVIIRGRELQNTTITTCRRATLHTNVQDASLSIVHPRSEQIILFIQPSLVDTGERGSVQGLNRTTRRQKTGAANVHAITTHGIDVESNGRRCAGTGSRIESGRHGRAGRIGGRSGQGRIPHTVGDGAHLTQNHETSPIGVEISIDEGSGVVVDIIPIGRIVDLRQINTDDHRASTIEIGEEIGSITAGSVVEVEQNFHRTTNHGDSIDEIVSLIVTRKSGRIESQEGRCRRSTNHKETISEDERRPEV